MKKITKSFIRLTTLFLLLSMLFGAVAFNVSASAPKGQGSLLPNPATTTKFTKLKNQVVSYVNKNNVYINMGSSIEKAEVLRDTVDSSSKSLIGILESYDPDTGLDKRALVQSVISLAANLAALAGPWGMVIGGAVNTALSAFNHFFPPKQIGEEAMSEIQCLEDTVLREFNKIKEQLYGIEDQLTDISKQMDDSTQEIIDGVKDLIKLNEDASRLENFYLSTEGNFSYIQYKNLVFGELTDNSRASSAYYKKYEAAKARGALESELDLYRTLFCREVMNDSNAFYDYIMGEDFSDSILLRYYNVAKEYDENTALENTLDFAADLLMTETMVNQTLYTMVFEHYMYLYINGLPYASDDEENLINDFKNGVLNDFLSKRERDIHNKIACDIATVMGLTDFYTVTEESGEVYDIVNSDPATFGNLRRGQTVHLNTYLFCDGLPAHGIKFVDYRFEVNGASFTDGKFKVDESTENTVTATLYYRDTPVSTMVFHVDDHAVFYGGSGAESDPYRIGNANGLFAINNDLSAYYSIIADIDCSTLDNTPSPIGSDNERADTYHPFNGVLYGNGHTVSNLSVSGTRYGGLFAIIGERGAVTELKLKNASITADVKTATDDLTVKCGAIAGENNGIVELCQISDSTVTATVNNDKANCCIELNAGGIVGRNYTTVSFCRTSNTTVSGNSTHDFGGELKIDKNTNFVYSGGICGYNIGYINNAEVTNTVTVKAEGKSVYNPERKIAPYVSLYAGGIAGKSNMDNNNISMSKSYVTDDKLVVPKTDKEVLDCQSGVKKNTVHVDIRKGAYVSNIEENKKSEIEKDFADFEIKTVGEWYKPGYKFTKIKNEDGSYTVSDQYQAGYGEFKTEGLEFYDGETEITDYTVIAALGFNTGNETAESVEKTVTVVIEYAPDKSYPENTVLLSVPVKITVLENYIKEIEIEEVEEQYAKGEFSPIGLTLKLVYAVGAPKYISINNTNLDQFVIEGEDTVGVNKYTVTYDGVTAEFNVNINCTHTGNFTNPESGYDEDTAHEDNAAATCTTLGRRVYKCRDCGDIRYLYSAKLPHEAETVNPITPTCEAEGYTGDKVCIHCEAILSNGVKLPKTAHSYVYLDENTHKCGDHTEAHSYTVTEQVVTEINKEGVPVTLVKYLLTCICEISEGVTYTSTVTDENNTPEQANKLPTVAVSKGYVLTEGERTVTVFVQLLNNPGIAAASFGIRYDEGLTLTDVQYGDLLKDSIMKTYNPISHGANFTWADGKVFEGNGNLLKLTFKVSDEAKINDVFGISVVYALKNTDGGFTVDGEELTPFITRAGSITVVDRLPGDVDGDGKVDLFDALLIAKHTTDEISLEGDSLIHADVDLNKKSNTDDIVAILRALTGGYGVDLLSNKFELTVYGNGLAGDSYTVDVDIYGGSYTDAGVKMPSRAGYKFLGFFTRPYGGTQVKLNGNIQYNTAQRSHQAIYAQWEINQITIEGDYTNRPVDKNGNPFDIVIYYPGENGSAPSISIERTYDIKFISTANKQVNDRRQLVYSLIGFTIANDSNNTINYYNVGEVLAALNMHIGNIVIKPVWNEQSPELYTSDNIISDYPNLGVEGYYWNKTWYGDNGQENEIESKSNILQYANKSEDNFGNTTYTVYAGGYSLIEFKLQFELGEGVTDVGLEHNLTVSINNPYQFKLNEAPVKRAYYNLIGWVDSQGNRYGTEELPCPDIKSIPEEALEIKGEGYLPIATLRPLWKSTHYVVRYHHNIDGENENSVAFKDYYIPLGNTHTTYSNESTIGFKRSGYRFGEWNMEAAGGADSSNPVHEVVCDTYVETAGEDIIVIDLYARWSKLYNVTLDLGGYATVPQQQYKVAYGYGLTYENLPTPTLKTEYNLYEFLGWYIGDTKITSATEVTATGAHTLTAKWNTVTYTITYNANGGNGTMSNSTFTTSSSTLKGNGFSRGDHTFLGWSTNKNATTPMYKNAASIVVTNLPEKNTTLYAIWVKTSYSTSFRTDKSTIDLRGGGVQRDYIYPNLEIQKLIDNGYKTLSVTITFYAKELRHDLWADNNESTVALFASYSGKYALLYDYEKLGGSNYQAHSKTITITLSIDTLGSSGNMYIYYCTHDMHGLGYDNGFSLRDAYVTITANR